MATYYLDPDGDSALTVTPIPGGTAFAGLDDAVRQPTTPDTSDGIYYVNSGAPHEGYALVTLTTFTLPSGYSVTSITAWVNFGTTSSPPSQNATFEIWIGGVQQAVHSNTHIDLTIPPYAFGSGWVYFTWNPTFQLTQSDIDNLQIKIILRSNGGGSDYAIAYAAYLEVVTGQVGATSIGVAHLTSGDAVHQPATTVNVAHVATAASDYVAADTDIAVDHAASGELSTLKPSETTTVTAGHLALAALSHRVCDSYTPAVLPSMRSLFTLAYSTLGLSLDLRVPIFGNERMLDVGLKVKRTLANFPRVTRKSTWPKIETFKYTFENLTEDQRNRFLDFTQTTAALEIQITDHENNTWLGVIIDPELVTSQVGRGCQFKIEFTFRGVRS